MFWSVGSEWRASIANWRSWPLRGARSTSPCSCTSCGKAVFAFGEEGLYLRADGFCIGGRVGAFPLRSDVGHLTDRQAYDFGREIWGGFKSSMGLGRFVDRQHSMRPRRMWNAVMLRSAMALVPLIVSRSVSSMVLVGAIHE